MNVQNSKLNLAQDYINIDKIREIMLNFLSLLGCQYFPKNQTTGTILNCAENFLPKLVIGKIDSLSEEVLALISAPSSAENTEYVKDLLLQYLEYQNGLRVAFPDKTFLFFHNPKSFLKRVFRNNFLENIDETSRNIFEEYLKKIQ